MQFRKNAPKPQANEASPAKNVFDTSPDSGKAAASKSASKTKKKAAWLDAPLPQFYDHELATEMVRQGYYSSIEEAYIEVPDSRLKTIRAKVDEYLMNSHPPIFWR